ncbi:hypothetical protein PACTADRAFT_52103 [Pachysolen tannophilus NRRL Y-2460]|uniref:Uncharacterized protein n=1 Tax=Pachysolen tannophilus NRRL Y-2460 TaxID=669874 RepID=A0A1E4TP52_PACTA|nr:hypothetical protein PACTADRAFT_52103 [Pachysolen tannophilus NRRL Y-2460]
MFQRSAALSNPGSRKVIVAALLSLPVVYYALTAKSRESKDFHKAFEKEYKAEMNSKNI